MQLADLISAEKETFSILKDFQRATVDRICSQFAAGQNRMLVSDEVGLGKTMVARGVLARCARQWYSTYGGKGSYLVVYVCSNASIARQNLRKLALDDAVMAAPGKLMDDTRLSMQHLKANEELRDADDNGGIRLLALTPQTSFELTSGGGICRERALICATLELLPEFDNLHAALEAELQKHVGEESWLKALKEMRNRLQGFPNMNARYPGEFLQSLKTQGAPLLAKLHNTLQEGRSIAFSQLTELRLLFSSLSVGMLCPDLVILDEFQRFNSLLKDDGSETSILAKRFFSSGAKILLLSATPYRLYQTGDECSAGDTTAFDDFLQLMDFLRMDRYQAFEAIWLNWVRQLKKAGPDSGHSLVEAARSAEASLYQTICRTERNRSDKIQLEVDTVCPATADIEAFVAGSALLRKTRASYPLPVDYAKSCPYLMSFMRDYKVRRDIVRWFIAHPAKVREVKDSKHHLWLNQADVATYKSVCTRHAKLKRLCESVFQHGAEKLLWVPPSSPAYRLDGVFKDFDPVEGHDHFSKKLIFSKWEMVPRMIGCLVSHEAECRTTGVMVNRVRKNSRVGQSLRYFAGDGSKSRRRRYPSRRLDPSKGNSFEPLFCLLYPSKTLADLWDPLEDRHFGKTVPLAELRDRIKQRIRDKIRNYNENRKDHNTDSFFSQSANSWVYLMPMLMDEDYARDWIAKAQAAVQSGNNDSVLARSLNALKEQFNNASMANRFPDWPALVDTLTDMAIASPAVCAFRALGGNAVQAFRVAKAIVSYFNSPETTAAASLSVLASRDKTFASGLPETDLSASAYWRVVLRYCACGCLQSTLDEYFSLLREELHSERLCDEDTEVAISTLSGASASYAIEMLKDFQTLTTAPSSEKRSQGTRMRAHFALAYTKSDSDDNTKQRKESIQAAFNSPFRPFVLATTSVGQEGLDFHRYCRCIVHWNLPSNPIDFEQREGRIARYKNLSVRQSVAVRYANQPIQSDVWKELFEYAEKDKPSGENDLVPCWALPGKAEAPIERLIPTYPLSRDEDLSQRLAKLLRLYRLALGQPDQESLLKRLGKWVHCDEARQNLTLCLSPIERMRRQNRPPSKA